MKQLQNRYCSMLICVAIIAVVSILARPVPGDTAKPPVVSRSKPNILFIAVDDLNDWVIGWISLTLIPETLKT